MKEFEKWVMGPASDDWIRDEFTGAEAAWRAALEEVLDQIEICNSDGSIIVWIKGELQDEN